MKKKPAEIYKLWPWLTGIIAIVVYLPALGNGFISWDDNLYVLNNPYLQELNFQQLRLMFSSYFMGNYHPLSMLSLSATHLHSGMEAWAYILTNILLHGLVSVLVYHFINKLINNPVPAFFGAVLFAVHPAHVESVAWISERKDLLYGLFFFAALLAWMRYSYQKEGKKMYFTALLFFMLALLSKGMAVSLSLVLVVLDWLNGRRLWNKQMWMDKIPFFALSLLFGIVAVLAQKPPKGLSHDFPYSYAEQILFAFYGLGAYLGKMVAPLELSAFYPYPAKDGLLPLRFYIVPVLVGAILITVLYKLAYQKINSNRKTAVAGLLFAIATLLMVLQFFPIGRTLMADRYLYVPLAGFSLVLAWALHYITNKKRYRLPVYVGIILYLCMLSVATAQRTLVWKDSRVFWTDVIEKHDNVPIAYASRAQYYTERGEYLKALDDLNKAVKLEPDTPLFLVQRASLRYDMGNLQASLTDYNQALQINPGHAEALTGRAMIYARAGNYTQALQDHQQAIRSEPQRARLYINRGLTYAQAGQYERAYVDYTKAIALKPQNAAAYVNRGSALRKLGRMQEAISDFSRAANLSPSMPPIYYNRGNTYRDMGQVQYAITDYQKAIQLDNQFLQAYVNLGTLYMQNNMPREALPLLNHALRLSPGHGQILFFRGQVLQMLGQNDQACQDFRSALQTGYTQAAVEIEKGCR